MELAGKRVLVVGFGKTGQALTRFLLGRGARVTVSEKRRDEDLGRRALVFKSRGVVFETGGHTRSTFREAEMIVPSPGAAAAPEIRSAIAAGVPVLSEIELASHFLRGRIVGVTGTNGKSTTTVLAYRILKDAGRKVYLAGNIGTPLISFAEKSRPEHLYVTEISSFQLEHIDRFRADLGVFLNVSRNHLDWHSSFEEYFAAKKKIFLNQTAADTAILNADDRLVRGLADSTSAKTYTFSLSRPVRRGSFPRDGWIVVRDGEEKRVLRLGEVRLPGAHNLENVMAAALVGHCLGVEPGRQRASIRNFSGLEHRLERVLTLRGVGFINDSKATTVDSTIKALESFDRKAVLILGGRDKGADFTLLRRPVKRWVKTIILLGEARDKIAAALRGAAPQREASSLREAVRLSLAAASAGDIVLFSPACTSFDMFRNFEDRGRAFKREVRRLRDRVRGGKA